MSRLHENEDFNGVDVSLHKEHGSFLLLMKSENWRENLSVWITKETFISFVNKLIDIDDMEELRQEESKVQGTDILFKGPDKPQDPPIPGVERVETEENKCDEEYDLVHRPQHYMQGHIETIDKIKLLLTPEEYLGYLKGNVIKYDRAPFKGNMEQDYDKQKVYYDWALEQMEEEE